MHFIYTLFIALANNLDNLSVRIAFSIRGIKISFWKNILISMITLVFSTISAFSGSIVSKLFNKNLSSILSMIVLTGIGLWIIFEPYISNKKRNKNNPDPQKYNVYNILMEPECADADNSKDIDFKEATFLGIALSLDTIGGGLSAGMIGINPFFVGILSALISFFALWLGNFITEIFRRLKFEKHTNLLAGTLLILIGIKQIL